MAKRPEHSEILYKQMRFLITDRPSDLLMDRFIEDLRRYNVTDVVRVCEPSYDNAKLIAAGINFLDLPFNDGTAPPEDIVERWFELLRTRFCDEQRDYVREISPCIAVHCVAGLGRAPVLVGISLIERGMKYENTVELIRQNRRHALNAKQLEYLEHYRPRHRLARNKNWFSWKRNPACVRNGASTGTNRPTDDRMLSQNDSPRIRPSQTALAGAKGGQNGPGLDGQETEAEASHKACIIL